MLLAIDYYALRADQYPWLVSFVESHPNKSLALFPNFSFALALGKFLTEQQPSGAHEDDATSADLLRDALLLHPYVLPIIVQKAPIQVRPQFHLSRNTLRDCALPAA